MDQVYSIGNTSQYSIMTYIGKESKIKWRHIYGLP